MDPFEVDAAGAGVFDATCVSGRCGAGGVGRGAGAGDGRASARRFGLVLTMREAGREGAAAVSADFVASPLGAIRPSDSVTADAGATGEPGAAVDAGAGALGAWLCRTAR